MTTKLYCFGESGNAYKAALALTLAGCGRPLTPEERLFSAELMGEGFDPGPVRIGQAGIIGLREVTYPVRPRTTCRERILPPPEGDTITGSTAGVVLFQTLWTSEDWFLENYAEGYPSRASLIALMFFAHEMLHVWQWQNRDRTGYHPLKAAAEHRPGVDPYLFDPEATTAFLDFGYEQQGALIEEYVCCRALDPEGARTRRLEALLQTELDLTPLARLTPPVETRLPWAGAETDGICS